jgi:hypothetical protein
MARRGGLLERAVLLAPDRVARAAARRASRRDERWLLCQPRAVRESYARHVLPAQDRGRSGEIWMLRQTDQVRESYVREVLDG